MFGVMIFISQSCGVYSFTGASIHADLKTINVENFENISSLVVPYLSNTFTEELKSRIRNQSSLSIVRGEANAIIDGRITDYSIRPVAIQGNERAGLNRMTIVVQVKFTNNVQPELNFEESFSAFQEFSIATQTLQSQESRLIGLINKQLSELIFNRAFANW